MSFKELLDSITGFFNKQSDKEQALALELHTALQLLEAKDKSIAFQDSMINNLSEEVKAKSLENAKLYSDLAQLAAIKEVEIETPLEAEINKKYQKIKIKYNCRPLWTKNSDGTFTKKMLSLDVQDFWDYQDQDIQAIATMIKVTNKSAWDAKDWDELVWHAEKYVKEKIKYVGDEKFTNTAEYWQFVYETLVLKTGDCEDGAWLISNIVAALLPPEERFRVHFCKGPVKGGLHGYVSYRRFKDNRSVILDWCYWPTSKKIPDRELHTDTQNYYGVDWSASHKTCFARPDYKGDAKTLVEVL